MVQVLNRSSNEAPLSERVQRKNEARRLEILRAAARVFRRLGLSATGMREIAEEADLSPGNLYYYFSGKDEILLFCQERTLVRLLNAVNSPGPIQRSSRGRCSGRSTGPRAGTGPRARDRSPRSPIRSPIISSEASSRQNEDGRPHERPPHPARERRGPAGFLRPIQDAARSAARGHEPHRHQARLRARRMRCLRGAGRGGARALLPRARPGLRRARDRNRRGTGERRQAASAAGGLRRPRRRSVRLLHPRDPDDGEGAARARAEPEPRANQGSDLGESVPLHRLPADLRIDRGGGKNNEDYAVILNEAKDLFFERRSRFFAALGMTGLWRRI